MPEKITLDEAKRRRAEKEQRERSMLLPIEGGKKHASEPMVRKIELVGWENMGAADMQTNLIAGIIGSEQFGMVYGESGSGKSFLTFDMVAHYALGREWMGHKVKGGGVLYIAAEGRGGWANRVEAFCRHHGIDEEQRTMTPFAFILESINLGRHGNGDVAAVIDAAKRAEDRFQKTVDVIVIDTMARATPGSNENDAGDMGAFVGNMDAIRRGTKASPLIVHHSGKNAAMGARGHSSLRAAVDAELEIERAKSGRVMRIRKSRDATDTEEVGFELRQIEIGTDDDQQPITSCIIARLDTAVAKRAKPPPKSLKLLMTVVAQAMDAHGIELQLPDSGPKVKAVDLEIVRSRHARKSGHLKPDSVRRVFDRAIDKAVTEEECLVSLELSERVWLFYPSKQPLSEG
jgi:RecA/RadA recombinase